MKLHHLILLSLAAGAVLSGCGKNSDPTSVAAPTLDTTPPAVPQSMRLVNDAASGRQTLVWSESAASDLAVYQVFEFSPDPSRDNAFDLVAETTGASFDLPSVSRTTTSYYKVRAKDQSGNASGFSVMFAADLLPTSQIGEPGAPPIQRNDP